MDNINDLNLQSLRSHDQIGPSVFVISHLHVREPEHLAIGRQPARLLGNELPLRTLFYIPGYLDISTQICLE